MCVGVDIMVGRTGEHFRVGIRILDHIDFVECFVFDRITHWQGQDTRQRSPCP